MKIYNKIVYDINDNIIEEDSYEYDHEDNNTQIKGKKR